MPNQTTNRPVDLSGLLRNQSQDPIIKGRWFPIRLSPDLATGELLNIGIGFIDSNNQLHTKILSSTTPFRKLYGSAGASNFGFLLALLREHFARIDSADQLTTVIDQAEAATVALDTGMFNAYIKNRIPQLASMIIKRFPQPDDLLAS